MDEFSNRTHSLLLTFNLCFEIHELVDGHGIRYQNSPPFACGPCLLLVPRPFVLQSEGALVE